MALTVNKCFMLVAVCFVILVVESASSEGLEEIICPFKDKEHPYIPEYCEKEMKKKPHRCLLEDHRDRITRPYWFSYRHNKFAFHDCPKTCLCKLW